MQVDLDRALREGERACDVLVRQPLHSQPRNLVLPCRQHARKLNVILAALGLTFDRRGDELLRQPALTRSDDLEAIEQGADRTLFQHETPGTPVYGGRDLLV